MSIQIIYPFTESDNYSKDPLKIEVTAGEAKLVGPAFSTDNPSIYSALFLQATGVKAFSSSESVSGSDEIRYTVLINGVETYWDGLVWTESTGYSETNTAADLNSNLSSLTLSEPSTIGFMAYLHSGDGTTTPALSEIAIDIDYIIEALNLSDAKVWNYLLDLSGNPLSGETIKVRSGWIVGDKVLTSDDYISVTTLSNGFWQIDMKIDDTEPDFLEWRFCEKIYKTNFLLGIHKFSELTVLDESVDGL